MWEYSLLSILLFCFYIYHSQVNLLKLCLNRFSPTLKTFSGSQLPKEKILALICLIPQYFLEYYTLVGLLTGLLSTNLDYSPIPSLVTWVLSFSQVLLDPLPLSYFFHSPSSCNFWYVIACAFLYCFWFFMFLKPATPPVVWSFKDRTMVYSTFLGPVPWHIEGMCSLITNSHP